MTHPAPSLNGLALTNDVGGRDGPFNKAAFDDLMDRIEIELIFCHTCKMTDIPDVVLPEEGYFFTLDTEDLRACIREFRNAVDAGNVFLYERDSTSPLKASS